jgi:carotenoid cleavage dioxygenase
VWIDVEPCYVYHPLNAYDDGDRVVIDLAVHDHAFTGEAREPGADRPRLQRWTIDPAARKVLAETIDDRGNEFPRADERLAGRPHRYGYTVGTAALGDLGGIDRTVAPPLRKHDVVAGTTTELHLGPGRVPSEVVFVPASEGAGEDEGWLVGYAYDAGRDASDLVVIDAADLTEVATVHLPVRVPYGFHGNFVAD